MEGNLSFLLCFTLYLRAISKYKPPGGLYLEERFNRRFFALRIWGAYILRGLFSEFYGIFPPLPCPRSYLARDHARSPRVYIKVQVQCRKKKKKACKKSASVISFFHNSFCILSTGKTQVKTFSLTLPFYLYDFQCTYARSYLISFDTRRGAHVLPGDSSLDHKIIIFIFSL